MNKTEQLLRDLIANYEDQIKDVNEAAKRKDTDTAYALADIATTTLKAFIDDHRTVLQSLGGCVVVDAGKVVWCLDCRLFRGGFCAALGKTISNAYNLDPACPIIRADRKGE